MDAQVVPFDQHRAAVTGLVLPSPPPTRITISGHTYAIQSPRAVLPPLINTVKLVLNWLGPGGRIARNVLYALKGTGTGSTSDPAFLAGVANSVITTLTSSNIMAQISNAWSIQNVVARDNGGTSASNISSLGPLPGTNATAVMPPQVAVAVSWTIAEVYRGGKPRTYLPGIPTSALTVAGGSQLTATYAGAIDTAATSFFLAFNSANVLSTAVTLGTVSYFTGHAVRPTPLFRQFVAVRVHERLDSQRRRSGAESLFPATP